MLCGALRVFDFETTGFPPGAAVVEVGWTDLRIGAGDPADAEMFGPVAYLANPMRANPELAIDPGAKAAHHIEECDLLDAPSPDAVLRRLGEGAAAFACHNIEFDGEFYTGGGHPMICTLRCARTIWPDAPTHSNQGLRYWLRLPVDRDIALPPHRAGPDSYVTAHLLREMFRLGHSVDELVEISSQPPLLKRLPFGKHKGQRFSDVPISYLQWLSRQDLRPDMRRTVGTHLEVKGAQP